MHACCAGHLELPLELGPLHEHVIRGLLHRLDPQVHREPLGLDGDVDLRIRGARIEARKENARGRMRPTASHAATHSFSVPSAQILWASKMTSKVVRVVCCAG